MVNVRKDSDGLETGRLYADSVDLLLTSSKAIQRVLFMLIEQMVWHILN